MRVAPGAALLLLIAPSASLAQSAELAAAIRDGRVGERYDGYMGFAQPPSDELRREVSAINIRRRSLYTEIASQRGVTIELVGRTTACALLRDLPVGEAYMLKDNGWHRRVANAAPPASDFCR